MIYSRGNNYSVTSGQVTSPTGAGTAITSAGSANTKGSYTEIVASTAIQAAGFILHIVKSTNNSSDYLIDIAIGGSGSEQIIVNNLAYSPVSFFGQQYFIPIGIPAGTRISARMQSTAATRTAWVHLTLTNGHLSYQRCETWGAATSDSGGVAIDGGTSANTKGTYVQLIASTAFPTKQVLFYIGNQGVSTRAANDFLYDIAVDISGTKQIVLADFGLHNVANFAPEPAVVGPFNLSLPAGSNIYARTQSLSTSITSRQFDIVGYGIG